MIDDKSPRGAWAEHLAWMKAREKADMAVNKRCEWCRHYRVTSPRSFPKASLPWERCALNKPLVPCEEYEREVGADDES